MTQQGGPRIRFGLTSIGTATASVTSKELPHLTASLFPSSRRHEQITFTSRSASWGGFSIHTALCSLAPAPQKKHVTDFQVPPRLTHRCRASLWEGDKRLDRGWGDTASTLPPGSLGAPKSQASVKRQQTQAVKRGSRGSPPAPEAPRPGRAGQGGAPAYLGPPPPRRSRSGADPERDAAPAGSSSGGRGGAGAGGEEGRGRAPHPPAGTCPRRGRAPIGGSGDFPFPQPSSSSLLLFLLRPSAKQTGHKEASSETPAPERGGG